MPFRISRALHKCCLGRTGLCVCVATSAVVLPGTVASFGAHGCPFGAPSRGLSDIKADWELPCPPTPPSPVYVAPKQGTEAVVVTLTLIEQTLEQPQHLIHSFTAAVGADGRGYRQFLSHDSLRARPGYLAGDTLVIRARAHLLV